jgi:hypothetical protein
MSSYSLNDTHTITYQVTGTVRMEPKRGASHYGCLFGSAEGTLGNFATFSIGPSFTTDDLGRYVEFTGSVFNQTWTTGIIPLWDRVLIEWPNYTDPVYYDTARDIPFSVTLELTGELVAERTSEPETGAIWEGSAGHGAELSKLQTITFSETLTDYVLNATLDGVSVTEQSGSVSGLSMQYGVVVGCQSRLTGTALTYDYTAAAMTYTVLCDGGDVTVVGTEYTDVTALESGPADGNEDILGSGVFTTATATGGGGKCSIKSARDFTGAQGDPIWLPDSGSHITYLGVCHVYDNCDASYVVPNCDLKYMWDRDTSEQWSVVGADCHELDAPYDNPANTDGEYIDINNLDSEDIKIAGRGELQFDADTNIAAALQYDTLMPPPTDGMLQYGGVPLRGIRWMGSWAMRSWGDYDSPYRVFSDPPPGAHGPYKISRLDGGNWIDGLTADNLPATPWDEETDFSGATEHDVTASPHLEMGQPAHWPWLPWPEWVPDLTTENPDDGEYTPPWYDSTAYISNQKYLTARDAGGELQTVLTIQLVAPGTSTEALHLGTDITVGDWTETGCTATTDAGMLKVVTTDTGPHTIVLDRPHGLATEARLTGRYAVIHWKASVDGAEATILIGAHSWTLTAAGVGWQDTEIDLCRPHNADMPFTQQQSIVGYEKPHEYMWKDAASVRPDDDELDGVDPYFDWEFEAGWGVGRVSNITITLAGHENEYQFGAVSVKRKTAAQGGFANLIVLPHQASWNDGRALGDFANPHSGHQVLSDPAEDNPGYADHYEYIKALLVVDGAVVMEIASGRLSLTSYDLDAETRAVEHTEYALLTGAGVEDFTSCYPRNDYTAAPVTTYTGQVQAVDSIAIATPVTEFLQQNLLVAGLIPGIYRANAANQIKVCFRLMTNTIAYSSGMNGYEFWDVTTWRGNGAVCGIAYDGMDALANSTVSVATPDASAGRGSDLDVATNGLGWYISDPLNTHADGAVVGAGDVVATLRNRMATRVVV